MLICEVEQRDHLTENREEKFPLDGLKLAHIIDGHNVGELQNRGYGANQERYSEEYHCENQLCLLLSEVRLPPPNLVEALDEENDADDQADEA